MKLLIRFMTLIIISIIISISLVYLININIMINERDNACKIAVESCQNIIKNKIIDSYLELDEEDYEIYNDQTYKDYFISAFNGLVSNNSIYDIDVYTEYDKGLIAVYIHNNYSSFIKDKKLINIVEVAG